MVYKRPGVYISEQLLQASPAIFPSSSSGAFVGVAASGPTTPVLIDSWIAFTRIYGGFSGPDTSLAHAVFQFFNNGGAQCWVVRAIGSSAAVATRTLLDRQGTPANVLRVDAENAGAWGNSIYVEILDVGITGRFNLVVRLGGSSDQYIVERWTDLALDPTDGRYAPNVINSSVSGSSYITVTDLFNHSTTFTPASNIPAVSAQPGGDVLAGGSDGNTPSLGASGGIYTAVTQLASVPDFMTLNIPNVTDATTINAVIAWAQTQDSVFLVIDCAVGRTPAQVVTDAAAYTQSSWAAVYYPRLVVADPSNTTPGATKVLAPGGAVIGQYAASDSVRGTAKSPAGVTTRLTGVVAMEYRPLDTELDTLNAANINAIRAIPGTGFCIFGARTLKLNQVDRYISARRTLIGIRRALVTVTRFAAFEPNDQTLRTRVTDACGQVLLQLWQSGGLRGASADQAFFVTCDESNNPDSAVNNGEIHVSIGVALETPAEFIVINLGQFESGSSVTEVL